LLLGIALASGEAERQRALDLGELGVGQIDLRRCSALLEMGGGAGAGNRHDVRRLGERSGDGQGRGLQSPCVGKSDKIAKPLAIAPPVEALKPRIGVAEILFAEAFDVLQKAAQIAARERRESDQNCAQFRAGLNEAKFRVARP
jgi:hypothetical protein